MIHTCWQWFGQVWFKNEHLGVNFGHYGQNIEAESLINLARCVLWCRINIVDCKDHVCGFFIWTALVKPYGGQTNMGWQGDIDHVSVIGHVWSNRCTKKIQIELNFFVSGHAHILGGLVDFQNFLTIVGVLIIFLEDKGQKMKIMHEIG